MKTAMRWFGATALAVASTFTAATVASADDGGSGKGHVVKVEMLDTCDPASFNRALGEGTCVPVKKRGKAVTFQQFLTQFDRGAHTGPPTWKFSKTELEIDEGDTLRVTNLGGEAHSFTEVPFFGGGCVPPLNDLTGLTDVVADCRPEADLATIQAPGTTRDISGVTAGTYHFICVIHPWMKASVEVEADD